MRQSDRNCADYERTERDVAQEYLVADEAMREAEPEPEYTHEYQVNSSARERG